MTELTSALPSSMEGLAGAVAALVVELSGFVGRGTMHTVQVVTVSGLSASQHAHFHPLDDELEAWPLKVKPVIADADAPPNVKPLLALSTVVGDEPSDKLVVDELDVKSLVRDAEPSGDEGLIFADDSRLKALPNEKPGVMDVEEVSSFAVSGA